MFYKGLQHLVSVKLVFFLFFSSSSSSKFRPKFGNCTLKSEFEIHVPFCFSKLIKLRDIPDYLGSHFAVSTIFKLHCIDLVRSYPRTKQIQSSGGSLHHYAGSLHQGLQSSGIMHNVVLVPWISGLHTTPL